MIYHPDATQIVFLADRFGSPVDLGDRVIVAVRASVYGGATLKEGVLSKLTPLVEHPNRMGHWHSTGAQSRIPMVRLDQLNRSAPTEYLMPGTESGPPDWRHAYIANVKLDNRGQALVVAYGWNLIKVPA